MLYQKIDNRLVELGYEKLLQRSAYVTTYVQTMSDGVRIIHIFQSVDGISIPQEKLIEGIRNTERQFLIKGYHIKEIMNLIVVDDDYEVDALEETGIKYWIINTTYKKLMIYENQPEDFCKLRNIIEEELDRAEEKPKLTQRVSEFLKNKQLVTFALVAINVIVFFLCNNYKTGELKADVLNKLGIFYEDVLGRHEYYRIITGMFLHIDYRHLANNMFLLLCIGIQVEKWIGHARFLLIYIAGGIGAGVISVVYHMQAGMPVISIGASGAVFAVFAAALIMLFFHSKPDPYRLVIIAALALIASSGDNVDTAAHTGGFIVGLITTLAFRVRVVFIRNN